MTIVSPRKRRGIAGEAELGIIGLPGFDPSAPLLEVDDLHVEFRTREGVARAVRGAGYSVDEGHTLGIVGESGSGKTVTAQAIMGILDSPPGVVTGGRVLYRGVDLLRLPEEQRRRVRANNIAMIFQDALSSLNPLFTVGFQVGELFRVRRGVSRSDARNKALELMDLVGIPAARDRIRDYPHQFSGGMRQRVMIAMALALDPEVLIADEPTAALDVTIQAQILDLLSHLQAERNMGLILITHDMSVVADVCEGVGVMYAGHIVERASVESLYTEPAHPYTRALLRSMPRVDRKRQRFDAIDGQPPRLTDIPPGCAYNPRCPLARQRCRQEDPPFYGVAAGHGSACHYWEEVLPR